MNGDLGEGAGDGGTDCHSQCAHRLRNDREFYRGCGGGTMWGAAPTEAYLVVRRGGALPLPRATARVAPTEGYKGCDGRATARVAPTKALHGVQ